MTCLAEEAEDDSQLFEGCLCLPATRISACDDQHLFDLLVRLHFSQERKIVLQAVQVGYHLLELAFLLCWPVALRPINGHTEAGSISSLPPAGVNGVRGASISACASLVSCCDYTHHHLLTESFGAARLGSLYSAADHRSKGAIIETMRGN